MNSSDVLAYQDAFVIRFQELKVKSMVLLGKSDTCSRRVRLYNAVYLHNDFDDGIRNADFHRGLFCGFLEKQVSREIVSREG